MHLRLSSRIAIVTAILLAAQIAFATILYFGVLDFRQQIQDMRKSQDILLWAMQMSREFLSSGQYLRVPTQDYELRAKKSRDEMNARKAQLLELTKGDPSLDWMNSEFTAYSAQFLTMSKAFEHPQYSAKLPSISMLLKSSQTLLEKFVRFCSDLDGESRERQSASLDKLKATLLLGLLSTVFIAILTALILSKQITSRLVLMCKKAEQFAIGNYVGDIIGGDDEVHELDVAFRQMADEIKLKQQEEQLLLDQALDCILSIDASGRITSVNQSSSTIFGIKNDDLIGRRYIEIIEHEYRESTKTNLDSVTNESNECQFETRVINSDGTPRDVMWSATWSRERRSWFCIVHDITERKELERRRRDFVSIVSHDLRSPLTSLTMSLNMLELGVREPLPEDVSTVVTKAKTILDDTVDLINNVLDTAKYEIGSWPVAFEETSIKQIVDKATENTEDLARASGLSVKTNIEDRPLIADFLQMARVMEILVKIACRNAEATIGSNIYIENSQSTAFSELRVLYIGRAIFEQFGILRFSS